MGTAVSTTPPSTAVPTAMATPTPASTATTTARGRLRPSPTTMAAAMAALDTTVEKVTTWTTAFHSYMPRPKTITTKNLFQQDLHHKTGRYCQKKQKNMSKFKTAMLIVSPTSIKCNNILVAEINNRALCLHK